MLPMHTLAITLLTDLREGLLNLYPSLFLRLWRKDEKTG